MLDISTTHQYNIYSEHGEDGILAYILDYIETYTDLAERTPRTYVYITDTHKPTTPLRNLSKAYAYSTNVPMSYNNGLIPCTMDGVSDWLSNPKKHAVHAHVRVLLVDVCGVDFWLVKTYLTHCDESQKPIVIIVRINYIVDPHKSISVPYAPPKRRLNIFNNHYYGASLAAYINMLTPHNYTFVGTTEYGIVGFFIQNMTGVDVVPIDPTTYLDAFSNIEYARMIRWPQVENKFWITVT
jgi:hypothetical protein